MQDTYHVRSEKLDWVIVGVAAMTSLKSGKNLPFFMIKSVQGVYEPSLVGLGLPLLILQLHAALSDLKPLAPDRRALGTDHPV